MHTCVKVSMEIGQILKLVCKHGIRLFCRTPARYIDEVVRVRDGDRPHPAHLAVRRVVSAKWQYTSPVQLRHRGRLESICVRGDSPPRLPIALPDFSVAQVSPSDQRHSTIHLSQ